VVAEIIYGDRVTSPRPTARHALASSALGVELGGAVGRLNARAARPAPSGARRQQVTWRDREPMLSLSGLPPYSQAS
jgi:hypothetical protein